MIEMKKANGYLILAVALVLGLVFASVAYASANIPPQDEDRRGPPQDGEYGRPPQGGEQQAPPQDVEQGRPPQDREQGGPHEKKIDKVLEQIGLSQKQKDQIREFHKVNREKAMQLMGILHAKRRDLGEELDKQNSDMRKIKILTEEIKDTEGRLIEQRVQSALELKQILTPEQYQKFNNSVKKFHRDDAGKKRR
jgi:Spy/CpxP family protein refolding chaperone